MFDGFDCKIMITLGNIQKRLVTEFFDKPVMENNLRGYWCEAMVAEQLGPTCAITSGSWAPWDLQIGKDSDNFPDRIRIQVKNSARLQAWHGTNSNPSVAQFNLTYRALPSYWIRDFPERPSDPEGFQCDVFALCFHDNHDILTADQRDPKQWRVFLLSANHADGDITESEYLSCKKAFKVSGRPVTLQRRPDTMMIGIRNRRPAHVVQLPDLTLALVNKVVGKDGML